MKYIVVKVYDGDFAVVGFTNGTLEEFYNKSKKSGYRFSDLKLIELKDEVFNSFWINNDACTNFLSTLRNG
jgi:hypothetical protein